MTGYLSWWVLATALSTVTLGFWYFARRPLGVSGSWAKIVLWREDSEIAHREAPFRNNPTLLRDALMAATIKEFGEQQVEMAVSQGIPHANVGDNMSTSNSSAKKPARTPWTAHFVFLMMLFVGGTISAYMQGPISLTFDLGETHSQLFGSGISYWLALFVGGLLVGFGTQFAGGCTSGHALSGVPRLVPASIIATATFFASAVAISFLLDFTGF